MTSAPRAAHCWVHCNRYLRPGPGACASCGRVYIAGLGSACLPRALWSSANPQTPNHNAGLGSLGAEAQPVTGANVGESASKKRDEDENSIVR